MVYALDTTTIDLCLNLFTGAPFCSVKAAVELHTSLDLQGVILDFIHITDSEVRISQTAPQDLYISTGLRLLTNREKMRRATQQEFLGRKSHIFLF